MRPLTGVTSFAVVTLLLLASPAGAQQMSNPYGAPIGVETARKLAQAAIAEGKKNGWAVAAAVVDPGGTLVYFERIDGTQSGSSEVAQAKARSAAAFKRPTKAFEEAVAGGRTAVLGLPGAIPLEGGIPLVVDGKIVGAIGVSGATSQQDGVCAKAGADLLGAPAQK
ncbi:MAG TPA: heme-binding protein [Myxococcaceae bacterium]|nr:heme-binding protein [Myxococcaceae bacterium]